MPRCFNIMAKRTRVAQARTANFICVFPRRPALQIVACIFDQRLRSGCCLLPRLLFIARCLPAIHLLSEGAADKKGLQAALLDPKADQPKPAVVACALAMFFGQTFEREKVA